MTSETPDVQDVTTAADRAAAAAWIARLHGEDRTPELEAGLRRWLAASAAHRRAFDLANDLWTEAERWPKQKVPTFVGWRRARTRFTAPRVLAAAAVLTSLVLSALFYFRDAGISTGVGEQRNLTLEDGTRVALNTSTTILVLYDSTVRRVELKEGEALFEVARHADRPFVVKAGPKEVRALGTSFLVKRQDQDIAVTLVEGKISVSPVIEETIPAAQQRRVQGQPRGDNLKRTAIEPGTAPQSSADVVTLVPGQRLTFVSTLAPAIDQPPLDAVMAWQRGQVVLDRAPLIEAIAEMNRYSRVKIGIKGPGVAQIPITGIFRAGDSENFALAVSDAYQLKLAREDGRILLSGASGKERTVL